MIEFPENMDLGLIALLVLGGIFIVIIFVLLVINYFREVKRVEKEREKGKERLDDEVSRINNHKKKR